MEKTTLYLTDDLRHGLKDMARRTQRRQADLIREAIAVYLRQQVRVQPSSIGAGEDSDLAGRDTENWLRSQWANR